MSFYSVVSHGNTPVIMGSGVVRERTIAVASAPRICIAGAFKATLSVDPAHSGELQLRVRADDNVLPLVQARSSQGVIHVDLDGVFANLSELSVEATLGPLSEVTARAASQVTVQNLSGDAVALASSDASRLRAQGRAAQWLLAANGGSQAQLTLDGAAERVVVEVREAGEVRLEGSAGELVLHASATARVRAGGPGFEAQRARVDLSGASDVRLRASHSVEGRVRMPSRLRLVCGGRIDLDGAYRRE